MGNQACLALASALRYCASLEALKVNHAPLTTNISHEVASFLVNSLPQSVHKLSIRGLASSYFKGFR